MVLRALRSRRPDRETPGRAPRRACALSSRNCACRGPAYSHEAAGARARCRATASCVAGCGGRRPEGKGGPLGWGPLGSAEERTSGHTAERLSCFCPLSLTLIFPRKRRRMEVRPRSKTTSFSFVPVPPGAPGGDSRQSGLLWLDCVTGVQRAPGLRRSIRPDPVRGAQEAKRWWKSARHAK